MKKILFAVLAYVSALSADSCTTCNPFTIPASLSTVDAFDFTKDGHCLVVAGVGGLRSFEIDNNCIINPTPISSVTESQLHTSVAISENNRCVASFTPNNQNSRINIYDFDPDICTIRTPAVQTIPVSQSSVNSQPKALAFSPNNRFLAFADAINQNVTLYSLQCTSCTDCSCRSDCCPNSCLVDETPAQVIPFPGVSFPQAILFSDDGRYLFILLSSFIAPSLITVYKCVNGQFVLLHPPQPTNGNFSIDLALSKNGCLAIANGVDQNISLFSFSESSLQFLTLVPAFQVPLSVSFSPDGRCLAVASVLGLNIFSFSQGCCIPEPLVPTTIDLVSYYTGYSNDGCLVSSTSTTPTELTSFKTKCGCTQVGN